MLCAKYQEAGLCGSREKCDRNYLVSKFAYVHFLFDATLNIVDIGKFAHKIIFKEKK